MRRVVLLSTMLFVAQIAFSRATDARSRYSRQHEFESGSQLHWSIKNDVLHVRVEAPANGWVGIGISEVGGMKGSDLVFYERMSGTLTDSHCLDAGMPVEDYCQDWVLVSSSLEDGKLIVEGKRALDTGDTQDRRIVDDTGADGHRVLVAFGDSQSISYHGANRHTATLHLFGDAAPPDPLDAVRTVAGIQHVDLVYNMWNVPNMETVYDSQCVDVQELLGLAPQSTDEPRHIVAFQPLLTPSAIPYMHHMVIRGFRGSQATPKPGGFRSRCVASQSFQGDGSMIYNWAGENASLVLPPQAGLRILGASYRRLEWETHWNNPRRLKGVNATGSGVRIWYTKHLRPMDAGVIQYGDANNILASRFGSHRGGFRGPGGVKLRPGWSSVHTHCPSEMTKHFKVPEVFVFRRFMHMHLVGERIVSRQIAASGEVVRTAEVDVYDASKSGGFNPLSTGAGFTLRRGDRLELDCYYQVRGRSVRFGSATADEMCQDFLFYYPAQPLPEEGACTLGGLNRGEFLGVKSYNSSAEVGRVFGTPRAECTAGGEHAA